jgi:tRNA threonylcarbamoyladenosine biosynthesis protein TsaB
MTFQDFLANKKTQLEQSAQRSVLAIDSSTQLASVALYANDQPLFSEECFRQKSHSEWINGAVERAIGSFAGGWNQLDLITVSHGPGSFTGVRVATNLAKTIAFAKEKPLMSFSSLEVLAHQAEATTETPYILPIINAFKNMVFCALYQREENGTIVELKEPQTVEVSQINDWISVAMTSATTSKVQLLGDGFFSYENTFDPAKNQRWLRTTCPKDHPVAKTLASLALNNWTKKQILHWRELVPTYLRASAAEENKNSK